MPFPCKKKKIQRTIQPLIYDTCSKSDLCLSQVLFSKQILKDHFQNPSYEKLLEINNFTVKERKIYPENNTFSKLKLIYIKRKLRFFPHSFISSTLPVDKQCYY